jgi:hypothetical protein
VVAAGWAGARVTYEDGGNINQENISGRSLAVVGPVNMPEAHRATFFFYLSSFSCNLSFSGLSNVKSLNKKLSICLDLWLREP